MSIALVRSRMASLMFEEATDDELRSRIAVAVLGGAEDPYAAAEFLARHAHSQWIL